MQVRSDPAQPSLTRLISTSLEGVELQKGELVRVLVLSALSDTMFLIDIKGRQLEASTDLALVPGQSLMLRADGMENGRLVLRLVKPAEEAGLKIAAHLQNMGFKTDEDLVAVASKLIQHDLPVTPENVRGMVNSVKWLGGFNPVNLETVAWVMARGLKANPQILQGMRNFLIRPQALPSLLQDLVRQLTMFEMPPSGSLSSGESIMRMPPGSQSSAGINPALAGLVPEATEAEALRLSNDLAGNPGSIARLDLKSMADIFKDILALVVVKDLEETESVASSLQSLIRGNKELIKALDLTRQLLNGATERVGPEASEVLRLVEVAEGEVIGQSAFNSAERQNLNSQPGFYYFAIPVEVKGSDRKVELKIYKDEPGSRRLDELDEIRLAVSLGTERLGLVVFHLTWRREGRLSIQGAVDNLQAKELIEQEFGTLQQNLQALGYQVRFDGIKLTGESERLRPVLEDNRSASFVAGIDITV
mgnify:CR=1 FL=1